MKNSKKLMLMLMDKLKMKPRPKVKVKAGLKMTKLSSLEKFLQIQGIVYNHKFKNFFQMTKRNIDILL